MESKIGLALSGGGYRAAAFHLGTLKALNRLGLLNKIDVISSVSGGSLISAYYGLHINEGFDEFERSFRRCLKKNSLWLFYVNLVAVFVIPVGLSWLYTPWFLLLFLLLIPWGYNIIPSSKLIEYRYNKIFFR
jgi:NTE family protein